VTESQSSQPSEERQPQRRQEQFAAILRLSRQMLDAARASDWLEVSNLESQRQDQLKNFFSQPAQANETTWLAQGIQQVLKLNDEIMSLGEEGKQEILKNMSDLSNGKKAAQAYAKTAR
jgi:hypothetical protein